MTKRQRQRQRRRLQTAASAAVRVAAEAVGGSGGLPHPAEAAGRGVRPGPRVVCVRGAARRALRQQCTPSLAIVAATESSIAMTMKLVTPARRMPSIHLRGARPIF